MRLLVLYEELAGYTVTCLNSFADQNKASILVVAKKINAVAPFSFENLHPGLVIKYREEFTEEELKKLVIDFKSDAVLLGGWANPQYLKLVKLLKKEQTILAFDNHWTGSLKQRIGAIYFKQYIKPYIKYAFVPGQAQVSFAKKLGFEHSTTRTGFYSCDFGLFNGYYLKYQSQKDKDFPKRFLFVGRYAPEKGIDVLWDAFVQWQEQNPSEWELWCLGKGPLSPVQHPKIKHFGFLQPEEMGPVIKDTGVFILPSTFEPWGVVVHEYASAGYPLLCSREVGASEAFITANINGFLVDARSKEQLIEKMNKFSTLNQDELRDMAIASAKAASILTPVIWSNELMKMCVNE